MLARQHWLDVLQMVLAVLMLLPIVQVIREHHHNVLPSKDLMERIYVEMPQQQHRQPIA